MMNKFKSVFLLVGILFLSFSFIFSSNAFAENKASISGATSKVSKIIRVGVIETVPFAVLDENGKASGLSIAIWEEIAKENNWHYQYIKLARDYKMAIQALNAHKVDVLLGPTPVTYVSRQNVDFSRPYFLDTIDILAIPKHNTFFGNIWFYLSHVFSELFLVIILLLFVMANLIWWCERGKRNIFDKRYLKGIGNAIWYLVHSFAAMDFTYPGTVKSKTAAILSSIWMVLAFLAAASVIAFFSSAFTLSQDNKNIFPIQSIHDIAGKPVAVFPEGHELLVAKKLGAKPILMQSYDDGIKLLTKGTVIGILDHRPILNEYLAKHPDVHAEVIGLSIEEDEYAFGFNRQSPLLLPFDLALTKLQDKNYVSMICRQFVSPEDAQNCDL